MKQVRFLCLPVDQRGASTVEYVVVVGVVGLTCLAAVRFFGKTVNTTADNLATCVRELDGSGCERPYDRDARSAPARSRLSGVSVASVAAPESTDTGLGEWALNLVFPAARAADAMPGVKHQAHVVGRKQLPGSPPSFDPASYSYEQGLQDVTARFQLTYEESHARELTKIANDAQVAFEPKESAGERLLSFNGGGCCPNMGPSDGNPAAPWEPAFDWERSVFVRGVGSRGKLGKKDFVMKGGFSEGTVYSFPSLDLEKVANGFSPEKLLEVAGLFNQLPTKVTATERAEFKVPTDREAYQTTTEPKRTTVPPQFAFMVSELIIALNDQYRDPRIGLGDWPSSQKGERDDVAWPDPELKLTQKHVDLLQTLANMDKALHDECPNMDDDCRQSVAEKCPEMTIECVRLLPKK